MKCSECRFYGIRAGQTEPHCLFNDRWTDDFDPGSMPCREDEEEE